MLKTATTTYLSIGKPLQTTDNLSGLEAVSYTHLTLPTKACSLPVIASGGADSVAHMVEAFEHGAHAVLAASIFHDGNMTVRQVKAELANHGVEVRI